MLEPKYSGVCRSFAEGQDGDKRKKLGQYVQVGSPVGFTDGKELWIMRQGYYRSPEKKGNKKIQIKEQEHLGLPESPSSVQQS